MLQANSDCSDNVSSVAKANQATACSFTTGFSFFVISGPPTKDQIQQICITNDCLTAMKAIRANQTTECQVWTNVKLYKDVLNPIAEVCPSTATLTTGNVTTTTKPTSASNSTASVTTPLSPTTTTPSPVTTTPSLTAPALVVTTAPSSSASTTTTAASKETHVTMIAGIGAAIVVSAIVVFLIFRSRRRQSAQDEDTYRPRPHDRVERAHTDALYNDVETPDQSTRGVSKYTKPSSTSTITSTEASSRPPSSRGRSTRGANAPSGGLWNDLDLNDARLELEDIRINESTRPIGRGGFCEVLIGRYQGKDVAVKRLRPELREDPESQTMLLAEAKTMTSLNHRHIVKLIGVAWHDPWDLCIVTELVRGTDMGKYVSHAKKHHAPLGFTTEKVLMALQIADALDYLHRQNPPVLHRDLKPANILVTGDNQAKLADFGVARENNATVKTTQVGTKLWMAPEQALSQKYDEKIDIFAFGVFLSELDTYQAPYSQTLHGRSMADAVFFENVRNGQLTVTFSGDETDPVAQLGRECVRVHPRDRPTASELFRRLQEILHAYQKRDDLRRALETIY